MGFLERKKKTKASIHQPSSYQILQTANARICFLKNKKNIKPGSCTWVGLEGPRI